MGTSGQVPFGPRTHISWANFLGVLWPYYPLLWPKAEECHKAASVPFGLFWPWPIWPFSRDLLGPFGRDPCGPGPFGPGPFGQGSFGRGPIVKFGSFGQFGRASVGPGPFGFGPFGLGPKWARDRSDFGNFAWFLGVHDSFRRSCHQSARD